MGEAFERGSFGELMTEVRALPGVRRVAFTWDVEAPADSARKWNARAWMVWTGGERLLHGWGRTGEEAFRALVAQAKAEIDPAPGAA